MHIHRISSTVATPKFPHQTIHMPAHNVERSTRKKAEWVKPAALLMKGGEFCKLTVDYR